MQTEENTGKYVMAMKCNEKLSDLLPSLTGVDSLTIEINPSLLGFFPREIQEAL